MRLLTLIFTFTLLSCQSSEAPDTPAVTIAPDIVASNFINTFFKEQNIEATAQLATGELKDKILNTSDKELNQLKSITAFEISDIKTEIKEETGLTVVSLKQTMTINGNEMTGNQSIVLKLIDNQWMVYHF